MSTAAVEKAPSALSVNEKADGAAAAAVEELSEEDKFHHVDLTDSKVLDKYRSAGEVLNNALKHVQSLAKQGTTILELCTESDKFVSDAVAKQYTAKQKDGSTVSRGVAFPTCISPNNVVGHYSPLASDKKTALKTGDVVKIDLGVQIDGYVVTGAHTFTVGGEPLTGRVADSLAATYQAAQAALRLLRPGTVNQQITDVIQAIAKDYGVEAVAGVLSHQMNRNQIDGKELIMQRNLEAEPGQPQKVPEYTIQSGEVWALDIVMSTGEGKPKASATHPTTIYMKHDSASYSVKGKITREVAQTINQKYQYFPFTMRALGSEAHAKFALREMKEHQMLEEYPVLAEKAGETVTHLKYTVLIRDNETVQLTGLPLDLSTVKTDKQVTSQIAKDALALEVRAKAKKAKKKAETKEAAAS